MWKYIIVLVLAFIVGMIFWLPIVGSLRRIPARRGRLVGLLVFQSLLLLAIMGIGAYFAITKFDGLIPVLIGYGVSLIMIVRKT